MDISRTIYMQRKRIGRKKYQLRHLVWRVYSRIFFGPTRWIRIYGSQPILVRVDDFRAYRITELGGSQESDITLWKQCAAFKPDVAIDAGANYGEFSVSIADRNIPIVAIEASPATVECLRRTLAPYPHTEVIHAAVSDHNGVAPFFYNIRSSGSASLASKVPETEKIKRRRNGRIVQSDVNVRTLDSLIPERIGRIPRSFIVKIDVEGFEREVVLGMEKLCAHARWWRGLVEFNPLAQRRAGKDPKKLWDALTYFHGFIISSRYDQDSLIHLSSSLPSMPPESLTDVVIGSGVPQEI